MEIIQSPVHFVDYLTSHWGRTSRIHRMLIKGNVGYLLKENKFQSFSEIYFSPFLREEIDIPLASWFKNLAET